MFIFFAQLFVEIWRNLWQLCD